jgi:hypothetical protein
LDAKWKILDATYADLGVDGADIYQLATYSGRYGCENVGLVYPATSSIPPGVREYRLRTPGNPLLSIHTINVRELALNGALPVELRPTPVTSLLEMVHAGIASSRY